MRSPSFHDLVPAAGRGVTAAGIAPMMGRQDQFRRAVQQVQK